ncbi:carbohydrate-binding module family 20 domain-containing protein [Streptacidiphilus fuscans]|uniref:Alpha-amylase n=1 Tax=Streptacidiphilus fuscans TaxID=2789292 RepID=A0A931FC84_9ACTN|nr:carbohydrate-binding module family 20 domain-containing protein [Streptacidiphilus fuscans]MBF9069467.1 alpha amylase C-terminal domain-containing protein [Streptacidiphilus fuscans]
MRKRIHIRRRTPSPGSTTPPSGGTARWVAVGVLVAAAVVVPLTTQAQPARAATGPDGGDVIANLFEWNWNSVANECTSELGPKGYGAVEVAPPQDSIRLSGTHPWWEVYQPIGYDLNSRMGNAAQFAAMVTTCHNAGVKVYADAVLNHMAGNNNTSTDSYGGDTFNSSTESYSQPGYTSADFHQYPGNCPNSDLSIQDWNNQTQVQDCDLSNLEDLATETTHVRQTEAGYLNSLIADGVDGFRMDAAKHIAQADMAAILAQVNNTTWTNQRPYVYQEVIPGSTNSALQPAAFESNGSVIEFTYAQDLKTQFTGDIANLKTFGQSWGLEPPSASTSMVTNHDTERNGSTLNYKSGASYILANLFELAWGYDVPQVYASFDWTNSDDSPPADANGYVTDTDCSNGWFCTDRNQGVANMVGWHNAVAGQPVANWYDDGSNLIAFSRGDRGWIAVNNESAAKTITVATGLPAGNYCDVIHGDLTPSTGACTGSTVVVATNGTATVTVPADDAVALYLPTAASGTVGESFNVNETTTYGQNVFLVGSIPALGNWDTSQAIPLSSSGYPVWSGTVSLPANTSIQYKYIIKNPDGSITWEPGNNHSFTTGGSGSGTLNDSW